MHYNYKKCNPEKTYVFKPGMEEEEYEKSPETAAGILFGILHAVYGYS